MPEPIWYRNKMMHSGIFLLRYQTEMTDAGMLMPALVLQMPLPTFGRQLQKGVHMLTQRGYTIGADAMLGEIYGGCGEYTLELI
jgi:hypothetical protein